jgi:hypothetical protein
LPPIEALQPQAKETMTQRRSKLAVLAMYSYMAAKALTFKIVRR